MDYLRKNFLPFGLTPVQAFNPGRTRGRRSPLSPRKFPKERSWTALRFPGVLDRMAEAGLVKKEENPEDRRSLRVSITAKARKMMDGLAEQRKAVNEELTSVLSLEEKLLFKRMLKEIKG